MIDDNSKPEIAKLGEKNRGISIAATIAIILSSILFILFMIYVSYFKDKNEKGNPIKSSVQSEAQATKKEFSFKKNKQEEAKEPLSQSAALRLNIQDKDKNTSKPAFKKYKSIPLKSDGAAELTNTANKELQKSEEEVPVIAERIKIDPNFLIPEGTYIPCSLATKFVSDVTGRITCIISEDVHSASGSVKLIEKGTKAIGMYQSGTLQHGKGRMFVIWTKLITPDFKRIKLVDTQVVGQLGEAGIDGWVDSHFFQRFGGALMLSTVKDIVKNAAERKRKESNNTVVNVNNMDNTQDTFVSIVEKMLENSINIPPTMYKNQGDIIGILVGRDIDFSKIYKLEIVK